MCSISVINASYNDAAVRMLKDSFSFHKKNIHLNGKLFHVRCCTHILNLLVHDGFSENKDVIDNVRESVNHIIASTMHLTMFSDIVKQLQLPNKRLILDYCTRWNAIYAMLSCVLEFKDIFLRLLISIAIILDLRNKMILIDFSFRVIYSEEEAPKQIYIVRDSLYDLYKGYMDKYAITNVGTSMENNVQESGVSNASTTSKISKGKVMTGRSKFERYIRSVDTVDNEKYGDFDALEWWKVNNLKFRILSKMACEILSIPITTVALESAFSDGGRVIDAYHSYLGTDTVQMLLCGSGWYRNYYGLKKKAKVSNFQVCTLFI
ncbi:hypothetical protein Goklo_014147 [Gossypium klotzschianum]|uniref:HAT C-terminal dimerisation domain-containing protein n=1 Tax=Gossypium klotzschianum TaxID=34286 RepID=A0A7J8U7E8_9ROSI|nr:hypothetical protein [Gossypium klotzschianum]